MITIITGTVDFKPEDAKKALEEAVPLIIDTRTERGCLAYVWSEDPASPGRIYVYEKWETTEDLAEHLAGQYYRSMLGLLQSYNMLGVDVQKHRVSLSEPVYDPNGVPRADFFTE
jgi:quinol monooxygenase YgiN